VEPSAVNKAPDSPGPASFRDLLSDAIGYREPRRIGYNAALALIVLGWTAFTWPHFRAAFAWQSLLLSVGELTIPASEAR
jgi:hypothetical protein